MSLQTTSLCHLRFTPRLCPTFRWSGQFSGRPFVVAQRFVSSTRGQGLGRNLNKGSPGTSLNAVLE